MMDLYDVESEFYDIFYFDYRDDIPLYKNFMCDRVLDIMCGTGRILYYLNPERGVGVDSNRKMLEIAKKNLEGKNIRLINEDARDFKLEEKFCLVIIGLNSLMMYPREERIKILKNAGEHVSRGGYLIVDILNPFGLVENMVYHGDTREKDGKIYSRFFVPRVEGDHWSILYFYDIVENEIIRRKYGKLHLYMIYMEELKEEFELANLNVEKVYGNYDLSDFTEESERIIMVSRHD